MSAELEEIYNTEAWRTLNYMIDDKIAQMQRYVAVIMKMCEANAKPVSYSQTDIVTRRVSYDKDGSEDFELQISLRDLDWLAESVKLLHKLKSEVMELQLYKLNLANDWDFSKGNNAFMKEIFGEREFNGVESGKDS